MNKSKNWLEDEIRKNDRVERKKAKTRSVGNFCSIFRRSYDEQSVVNCRLRKKNAYNLIKKIERSRDVLNLNHNILLIEKINLLILNVTNKTEKLLKRISPFLIYYAGEKELEFLVKKLITKKIGNINIEFGQKYEKSVRNIITNSEVPQIFSIKKTKKKESYLRIVWNEGIFVKI